jgi:hypothetical protein
MSATTDGYDAGLDWDVSGYSSWREVLADRASWPQGNEAFMRGVRAALSDRAAGTVDLDAPGPSARGQEMKTRQAGSRAPKTRHGRHSGRHSRGTYYLKRNPDSALTLAEAGLIQDALLIGIGAGLAAIVGYILWQKYGLNSDQSQADAAAQVQGYQPSPQQGSTIPNPSVFSDQNPLAPWLPIGPAA